MKTKVYTPEPRGSRISRLDKTAGAQTEQQPALSDLIATHYKDLLRSGTSPKDAAAQILRIASIGIERGQR